MFMVIKNQKSLGGHKGFFFAARQDHVTNVLMSFQLRCGQSYVVVRS